MTGSLKAKLCVEGKAQLYDYCISNDIPHKRVTKLLVATTERLVQTAGLLHKHCPDCTSGATHVACLHVSPTCP